MVREQHVDPPLEGSEMETDIPPDVLKGLGQIIRPGGLLSPNGLRWETGQRTRGSSQRQAQARLRRPQEPAVGPRLPSCSLLLGHRRVTGEARCQVMGWEGRPLAGLGPGVGVPGPALPGPHQTAKHNAPLRQSDNQPFQSQGSLAGVPRTCFSLAPVSQSLGVNDSGNNERGAGLSS